MIRTHGGVVCVNASYLDVDLSLHVDRDPGLRPCDTGKSQGRDEYERKEVKTGGGGREKNQKKKQGEKSRKGGSRSSSDLKRACPYLDGAEDEPQKKSSREKRKGKGEPRGHRLLEL